MTIPMAVGIAALLVLVVVGLVLRSRKGAVSMAPPTVSTTAPSLRTSSNSGPAAGSAGSSTQGASTVPTDPVAEARRRRIMEMIIKQLTDQCGLEPLQDKLVMLRLLESVVAQDKVLMEDGSATFDLPFLSANADGPIHFKMTIQLRDVT